MCQARATQEMPPIMFSLEIEKVPLCGSSSKIRRIAQLEGPLMLSFYDLFFKYFEVPLWPFLLGIVVMLKLQKSEVMFVLFRYERSSYKIYECK